MRVQLGPRRRPGAHRAPPTTCRFRGFLGEIDAALARQPSSVIARPGAVGETLEKAGAPMRRAPSLVVAARPGGAARRGSRDLARARSDGRRWPAGRRWPKGGAPMPSAWFAERLARGARDPIARFGRAAIAFERGEERRRPRPTTRRCCTAAGGAARRADFERRRWLRSRRRGVRALFPRSRRRPGGGSCLDAVRPAELARRGSAPLAGPLRAGALRADAARRARRRRRARPRRGRRPAAPDWSFRSDGRRRSRIWISTRRAPRPLPAPTPGGRSPRRVPA